MLPPGSSTAISSPSNIREGAAEGGQHVRSERDIEHVAAAAAWAHEEVTPPETEVTVSFALPGRHKKTGTFPMVRSALREVEERVQRVATLLVRAFLKYTFFVC